MTKIEGLSRTAKVVSYLAKRMVCVRMIITDTKGFGEALRSRRKALGYTQGFLSAFTGFSVSFISDLENGKSTAELGKALQLANLLGLDVTLTPRG